ncbi:cob(I)yrinic acid a,c-diamide adenosyltransferase [Tissierella pigra]|uniref:Corrinoid adenosyltransferase n=1 Tax=Tissierella pigra TaxID=2607614 RepID=A0A6N7XHT7_9FIRM|nr:cob(I)yrinic acid a,c-diamide adenosyltransferase [Tissierella pigra]MBU5426241.1 cob(I)yrinic acid a,c-diamide adenosyltransferase [Tissierella pigra]MSU01226.1 cob(I)yrinic acid a,c-diamide adenosyltransferase [Tissierella pigra]
MQIYTRTGDKGYTKIIGGIQLAKDSERIKAYGTIDELNSFVGYAITLIKNNDSLKNELTQIQQYLFDCGNDLATPAGKGIYRVTSDLTQWIEKCIDDYAGIPKEVESFILPGGSQVASILHICRTIARRAEREIVTFQWTNDMNEEVLIFINRLSDYFFSLARVVNANEGIEDVLYERSGKVFHINLKKEDL